MVTTISEEMSVNRLVRPSRKTVRGTAAPPVRSRTSRRRWARSSAVELETWYTRTPPDASVVESGHGPGRELARHLARRRDAEHAAARERHVEDRLPEHPAEGGLVGDGDLLALVHLVLELREGDRLDGQRHETLAVLRAVDARRALRRLERILQRRADDRARLRLGHQVARGEPAARLAALALDELLVARLVGGLGLGALGPGARSALRGRRGLVETSLGGGVLRRLGD